MRMKKPRADNITCFGGRTQDITFQLAVLWGSSKREYPWRIANWVEEIRSLSNLLSVSFQHVVHEFNIVADVLARNGVSRTFLVFDV